MNENTKLLLVGKELFAWTFADPEILQWQWTLLYTHIKTKVSLLVILPWWTLSPVLLNNIYMLKRIILTSSVNTKGLTPGRRGPPATLNTTLDAFLTPSPLDPGMARVCWTMVIGLNILFWGEMLWGALWQHKQALQLSLSCVGVYVHTCMSSTSCCVQVKEWMSKATVWSGRVTFALYV